ncbi:hypothetical protein DPEC_G00028270 [Dallia pectoralis]|uniref:Uncharacterized protein n=1 Tax=Dallia pectoralis TaxID=75939 RepID=A0ACC2HIR7_DALPE|nr:hypothetical protein DPEC_G00028270 [Dallia pectoralis]
MEPNPSCSFFSIREARVALGLPGVRPRWRRKPPGGGLGIFLQVRDQLSGCDSSESPWAEDGFRSGDKPLSLSVTHLFFSSWWRATKPTWAESHPPADRAWSGDPQPAPPAGYASIENDPERQLPGLSYAERSCRKKAPRSLFGKWGDEVLNLNTGLPQAPCVFE